MKVFTQLTRILPVFRSNTYSSMMVRLASGPVGEALARRSNAPGRRVRLFRRVLVVADVNIGDAILLQPAVDAIRHRFPECRVDSAFNQKMGTLLGPDPAIDRAFAILRGGAQGAAGNINRINEILERRAYDLVVSFCPFVTAGRLERAGCPVVTPLGFAIDLLRGFGSEEIASMPHRVAAWIDSVVGPDVGIPRECAEPAAIAGTRVFLPTASVERATRLIGRAFREENGIVYVNPDTSNYSTFLGPDFLLDVLRRLLESRPVRGVLLGRGFTYSGVEDELLDALSSHELARVRTVPRDLSLEDFAALVDRCRVYVGGDTGPLHIAAARKIEPTHRFRPRNRLGVVGVFKATEPRIYGYDSRRSDMVGSAQDADAVTVESRPPCKNLTCSLQRISASCRARECQNALEPSRVVDAVLGILHESESTREWLSPTGTLGS